MLVSCCDIGKEPNCFLKMEKIKKQNTFQKQSTDEKKNKLNKTTSKPQLVQWPISKHSLQVSSPLTLPAHNLYCTVKAEHAGDQYKTDMINSLGQIITYTRSVSIHWERYWLKPYIHFALLESQPCFKILISFAKKFGKTPYKKGLL